MHANQVSRKCGRYTPPVRHGFKYTTCPPSSVRFIHSLATSHSVITSAVSDCSLLIMLCVRIPLVMFISCQESRGFPKKAGGEPQGTTRSACICRTGGAASKQFFSCLSTQEHFRIVHFLTCSRIYVRFDLLSCPTPLCTLVPTMCWCFSRFVVLHIRSKLLSLRLLSRRKTIRGSLLSHPVAFEIGYVHLCAFPRIFYVFRTLSRYVCRR